MSKQSREVRSGLAHPKNHVSERLPPRSPESSGYRFSFERAPNTHRAARLFHRRAHPRPATARIAIEHATGACLRGERTPRRRALGERRAARASRPDRDDSERRIVLSRLERTGTRGRRSAPSAVALPDERRVPRRRARARRVTRGVSSSVASRADADRPPLPKRQAHDGCPRRAEHHPERPQGQGEEQDPLEVPARRTLGRAEPQQRRAGEAAEQAREAGERDAEALVHRGAG